MSPGAVPGYGLLPPVCMGTSPLSLILGRPGVKRLFSHRISKTPQALPKGVIAVSYTHLDVYKRQAFSLSVCRRALFDRRWAQAVIKPPDTVCKAEPSRCLLMLVSAPPFPGAAAVTSEPQCSARCSAILGSLRPQSPQAAPRHRFAVPAGTARQERTPSPLSH